MAVTAVQAAAEARRQWWLARWQPRVAAASGDELARLRGEVASTITAGMLANDADAVEAYRGLGGLITREVSSRAAVLAAAGPQPPVDVFSAAADATPRFTAGQLRELRRELARSRAAGVWSPQHQALFDAISAERERRGLHRRQQTAVRRGQRGAAIAGHVRKGRAVRDKFDTWLASATPLKPATAQVRMNLAQTLADRVRAATDAQLTRALADAAGRWRELITAELQRRGLAAITGDEETG